MARKKAFALRYSKQLPAPVLIASGVGPRAEKIMELAQIYGIPIEEQAELAEHLVKMQLGDIIPTDLYSITAILYKKIYRKK